MLLEANIHLQQNAVLLMYMQQFLNIYAQNYKNMYMYAPAADLIDLRAFKTVTEDFFAYQY